MSKEKLKRIFGIEYVPGERPLKEHDHSFLDPRLQDTLSEIRDELCWIRKQIITNTVDLRWIKRILWACISICLLHFAWCYLGI